MIAARIPAALRSSESATAASVAALITQTPAASPSTPSIRLITFAIATIPITVSELAEVDLADQRQLDELGARPGSTPPTNGSVKTSTVTPAETGMIAAATSARAA